MGRKNKKQRARKKIFPDECDIRYGSRLNFKRQRHEYTESELTEVSAKSELKRAYNDKQSEYIENESIDDTNVKNDDTYFNNNDTRAINDETVTDSNEIYAIEDDTDIENNDMHFNKDNTHINKIDIFVENNYTYVENRDAYVDKSDIHLNKEGYHVKNMRKHVGKDCIFAENINMHIVNVNVIAENTRVDNNDCKNPFFNHIIRTVGTKRISVSNHNASSGYKSTSISANNDIPIANFIKNDFGDGEATTSTYDNGIRTGCNDVTTDETVSEIVERDNTAVNTRNKHSLDRFGKRRLIEEDDMKLKETLPGNGSLSYDTNKGERDQRRDSPVEQGHSKRIKTENVTVPLRPDTRRCPANEQPCIRSRNAKESDITLLQSPTILSIDGSKKIKDSTDKKSQIENVGNEAEKEEFRKNGRRRKKNMKKRINDQRKETAISRKENNVLKNDTTFDREKTKSNVTDKDRKSVTEKNSTAVNRNIKCSKLVVVIKERSEEAISSVKENIFSYDSHITQDSETNDNNELNAEIDNWESADRKRKSCLHKRKGELGGSLSIHEKVQQKSSTAERTEYFDKGKPVKPNIEGNIYEVLTIYSLRYRKWDIPCLKCRANINNHIKNQQIFYQHEELTVISRTQVDQGKAIKLCELFDNNFVIKRYTLFVTFWKQILKYVTDDKHTIDLHGMTILVAQAAIEFAVENESQYVKYLHGIGKRTYRKLKIISGRGAHSRGPPVLRDTVVEHLQKLKCKRFKRSTENPGLFEVDVR